MEKMADTGVYKSQKKNGEIYYRSSFTYKNKHISLGSFSTSKSAHACYKDALRIIKSNLSINDYNEHRFTISFEKYVSIINFRDNNVYFSNPIYLYKRYFEYYFTKRDFLKFDIDDLFYYAEHKISRRGGHLFVSDYGMQLNLLNRYGIKSHAVCKRDYRFINEDPTDFRYENIEIINPYFGVSKNIKNGKTYYKAKILIKGNYLIGNYKDVQTAAIAYNKAADYISGFMDKHYQQNFIDGMSNKEYAEIYTGIVLPEKILGLKKQVN